MFIRLVVAVLAVVGLFSLLSGGSVMATGTGVVLLAPLLIFGKIAGVMLILGMIGRGFGHRSPWGRPSHRRPDRHGHATDPISEADFDEWHRLSHAKEEVEGWVTEVT